MYPNSPYKASKIFNKKTGKKKSHNFSVCYFRKNCFHSVTCYLN